MPHQEGGCRAGVPHNIPPSSTSGTKKASPGGPLRNIANYSSAGWRKDLSHILRSFYWYNYPSCKEEEWNKFKTEFFDYLGQHQEEWKTIKEEKPLQYMPYMEPQFKTLTGIKLKGLSQFAGWIKPGSYYHGVVARKGQLHLCLHLAGTVPPRGPQIHPSQTHTVMQKREETPTTSPHITGKEVAQPKGHALMLPLPWRQMEWGMAGPGWNRPRPVPRKNGGEIDLQSITSHCLGDGKLGLPIPSHSRIAREGTRQYSSSTGMQVSTPQPVMMWLSKDWPATTPDLESGMAKSLNNQVLCMILEYHLTCLSQGPSYISLVLLEAAKNLLPSMEEYMAGGDFQGTWDLRVLERAKTL